jgi:hypothetical protein
MCCSNPHQSPGHLTMGMSAGKCGCGCIGREPNAWHLKNYKEYLEAELAAVEKQIHAIRKTNP